MAVLGEESEPLISIFRNAYEGSKNLSEATRKIMHALFGEYGLVVLDADDHSLKNLFSDVMRREFLDQVSFPVVQEDQQIMVIA